jgi:hypothetical protein
VIDEDMLSGYTDAELAYVTSGGYRLVDQFERVLATGRPQTNIIHLVSTEGSPDIVNAHPLDWWMAHDSLHSWMTA